MFRSGKGQNLVSAAAAHGLGVIPTEVSITPLSMRQKNDSETWIFISTFIKQLPPIGSTGRRQEESIYVQDVLSMRHTAMKGPKQSLRLDSPASCMADLK